MRFKTLSVQTAAQTFKKITEWFSEKSRIYVIY